MRAAIFVLLLAGVAHAVCDPALKSTITPRIKLQRPSTMMCDWDVPIQQSFDILDAGVGMVGFPQTWTSQQTFNQIVITAGQPGTTSILQSDANGTGFWTPDPHVNSLTVDTTLTVNGRPVTGGGQGESRRLGGVLFDLGAVSLTTSDGWTFRLEPYAASITRLECEAYTGTSFTMKLCAGEDPTCATPITPGPVVCDTTGLSTTSLNNTAVTARQKVTVVITAVSGTVTKGEIYIEGVVS